MESPSPTNDVYTNWQQSYQALVQETNELLYDRIGRLLAGDEVNYYFHYVDFTVGGDNDVCNIFGRFFKMIATLTKNLCYCFKLLLCIKVDVEIHKDAVVNTNLWRDWK